MNWNTESKTALVDPYSVVPHTSSKTIIQTRKSGGESFKVGDEDLIGRYFKRTILSSTLYLMRLQVLAR